jgi:hypothetical protein
MVMDGSHTQRGRTKESRETRLLLKTQWMLGIFRDLRKKQIQAGSALDNPSLVYIEKTILSFEEDLETLRKNVNPA